MKPSGTIEIYLEQQGVSYEIILHQHAATIEEAAKAANVGLSQMVRAVILNDDAGMLMLVLPANHLIDFSELKYRFGDTLELAPIDEVTNLFTGGHEKIVPPWPGIMACGLP